MISFRNCAFGLSAPFAWFFTATAASCSCVVPYSWMWRIAIIAYTPGNVRPASRSHSVSPETPSQNRFRTSDTSFMTSTPPASARSTAPDFTAR